MKSLDGFDALHEGRYARYGCALELARALSSCLLRPLASRPVEKVGLELTGCDCWPFSGIGENFGEIMRNRSEIWAEVRFLVVGIQGEALENACTGSSAAGWQAADRPQNGADPDRG
jgi:hypothetical protein